MYGEGEIRIGNSLQLSDDIYNIGFICQIRNDIIDKHIDVLKKKLDRKDVVRKKANRLHATKKKQEVVVESSSSSSDNEGNKSDEGGNMLEHMNYDEIKEQEEKIFFMTRVFNIRNNKRINILLHVFLCFFCQIVLTVSIAGYLYRVSNF